MNQVIHFDTQAVRPGYAWVRGSNHGLPSDIRIQWAIEVSDDFHARFSALSRTYCYVIYNASVPSALLNRKTTWILTELNISWMQAASTYLIGEQDFSSFRGSQCQSKTPIRYVKEIVITRQGPFILLTITANAFLHHMVRNIVGSLLQVGRGESDPVWIKSVLEAKDRTKAGSMAPPDGLYLMNVEYAPDFFIPARTRWTLA